MEADLSDIAPRPVKSIFETIFRKNVFMVITFVIIANGYSNIPGVSELLTKLFTSQLNRFIITFILFFQIIDNVGDTFIWTCIITFVLYIIEQRHHIKEKSLTGVAH
jgi:hypothetical protein